MQPATGCLAPQDTEGPQYQLPPPCTITTTSPLTSLPAPQHVAQPNSHPEIHKTFKKISALYKVPRENKELPPQNHLRKQENPPLLPL